MIRIVLLLLLIAAPAYAHKPSDSYLTLSMGEKVSGHWDLALRDLDRALELDTDHNGELTGRELRAAGVARYAFDRLSIDGCRLRPGETTLVGHSDGQYARIAFDGTCTGEPTLRYAFFFDLDPQHRAVVRAGEDTFVLTSQERSHALSAPSLFALVGHGIHHILSGLDHVLFLLALLLPCVIRKREGLWRDVFKVVTAFTVAHSLTLAMAALGVVSMSASLVEPAIAASVALAAVDNIWPVFGDKRASIAFALGLLHGFGFSSALSDLGLSGYALLKALLAFNIGVELGQLALIAVFLPIALALRNVRFYERVVVRGGSLAIGACALVWFAERVAGG